MNRRTSMVDSEGGKPKDGSRLDEQGRFMPPVSRLARSSRVADALPYLTYHHTGRTCSLCGKPIVAKGLCSTHYQQERRTGSAVPVRLVGADLTTRFWSKVRKGEKPEDCWTWLGGHFATGYGAIWFQGKTLYAHRVSYALAHGGVLPLGLDDLDHLCRNRTCVNADHLELVSHKENMRRSPLVFKHGRRAKE